MKKRYVLISILLVLSLGILIDSALFNNDIPEVKNAKSIWDESVPVERQVLSSGNEGIEEVEIIEEYEETEDSGWIKTGDGKVYWENTELYISSDPHTCNSFSCNHNIEVKNKELSDKQVNLAFIFSEKPVSINIKRLETLEKTRDIYETTQDTHVTQNGTEVTNYIQNKIGEETYNVEEYVDRNDAFILTEIDGKWAYLTTDYSISASSQHDLTLSYSMSPKRTQDGYVSNGKWDLYLWEGSYNNPDYSITLDPWFDISYDFRKQITIDNNNATEEIEEYFNVTLTVDTSTLISGGKMLSSCDDLRITYGETSELNRTVSSCNSATSKVAFRVKSDIVGGGSDSNYYMYYGNNTPIGTPPTNPRGIYEFYADFESCTNGQDPADCEEHINTTSGLTIATFGTKVASDSSGSTGGIINFIDGDLDRAIKNQHAYYESYVSSWGGSGANTGVVLRDDIYGSSRDLEWLFDYDDGFGGFDIFVDGFRIGDGSADSTTGSWRPIEAITWNNSAEFYADHSLKSSGSNNTNLGQGFTSIYSGESAVTYIDNIIITGYIEPAPTLTLGIESTAQGLEVQLNSPTNGFTNTTVEGDTPFNYTVLSLNNATAFFINASLYHNESGTFELISSNTSELINATPQVILDELGDGVYLWNIELCGDDLEELCIFNTENFTYTVTTTPIIQNINITPNGSQPYQTDEWNYNLTWFDDGNNFNISILEHNLTGTFVNYTMENITEYAESTNFTLFQNIEPAVGNYTLRIIGNDTVGNTNTTTFSINITAISSDIEITSTQGFSIPDGTNTELECTTGGHVTDTPSLEVDSVIVSNPFSQSFSAGDYNITCSIPNTNFTDSTVTQTLRVNPLSLCTSDETFAFRKVVTNPNNAYHSWDFSSIVNSNQVRDTLGDVYVPNVTEGNQSVTINSSHYIFNVNTSGASLSTYNLEFGNYFANRSYTNTTHNSSQISTVTGQSQINPYINYNILDEITFQELYPPNSTVNLFITCNNGESFIPIEEDDTKFLLAVDTGQNLNKSLLQVKYDADSFYSRQLYPEEADVLTLNKYVVDAFEFALDRIDFVMDDVRHFDARLIIYKSVGGERITITEGFFDASHEFSAFLREDTDYFLLVVDDDGTETDFGRITPQEPTIKTLSDLKLGLSPEAQLLQNNLLINSVRSENKSFIFVEYDDNLAETNYVVVQVYHENGTIFNNETVLADSFDRTYNVTNFENESFRVDVRASHETYGNSDIKVSFNLAQDITQSIGISDLAKFLIALGVLMSLAGWATRDSLIISMILFSISLGLFMATGFIEKDYRLLLTVIFLFIFAYTTHIKRGNEE